MSAKLSNSGVDFNSGSNLNPGGSAPSYTCRAWVNFNSSGGVRGSGNVSSVGQNSTGNFTVNLATALADANYSGIGMTSGGNNGLQSTIQLDSSLTITASAFRVQCGQGQVGPTNQSYTFIAIFR